VEAEAVAMQPGEGLAVIVVVIASRLEANSCSRRLGAVRQRLEPGEAKRGARWARKGCGGKVPWGPVCTLSDRTVISNGIGHLRLISQGNGRGLWVH